MTDKWPKVLVTGTRGIPGVMGGVETHCEELMPRLVARGADVTVVRRTTYVADGLREWHGVKLADVRSPKSKSLEALLHTIRSVWMAKRLGVDLVHIHAVGPGLLVPLAKLLGLRVVFTHHGFDYDRAKWGGPARLALRLGERLAVRHADEVIAISNVIENVLRKKHGRTDCRIIPNGAPDGTRLPPEREREILAAWGLEPGGYFFAPCRFVPEKNLHHLVEAWESAAPIRSRLVLAGTADFEDPYSRSLFKRAKNAGVILPGFVRGESLKALWGGAKAFFLASSHEGLPVALLEAMAYGVPAWVSDIPANREVALGDSRYFRVGDVAFLRDTMRALDSAPFTRVDYDLRPYDWDRLADATFEAYRAAARPRR
ncbi:MAG: glycosyltransferase family 4 protein [Kiritimatiellae bacterium]|nr:glycosyltransferase family 4 protein [Kiritimatiellia bacterium]